MTDMHMTPRGRQRLTDREGKRLTAYRDSKGIWTIGVGHATTSGRAPIPHAGMTITAQVPVGRLLVPIRLLIERSPGFHLHEAEHSASCAAMKSSFMVSFPSRS